MLEQISSEERVLKLTAMSYEDWTDEEGWDKLSDEIRYDFEEEEDVKVDLNDQKYDEVLLINLRYDLRAATNAYLCNQLNIDIIEEGKALELLACPCCGRKTITERGDFDICKVCWWEDDGTDNNSSDTTGGPNYDVSLAKARYNFIIHEIYDERRKDLKENKDPKDKYHIGRIFKIVDARIVEEGTEWSRTVMGWIDGDI